MLYREYHINNENDIYNLGVEINNNYIHFTLFNYNNKLDNIYKNKTSIIDLINILKINNNIQYNPNLLLNEFDIIFNNNKT